ncbi:DUF4296 domain-containing protein [uncultured Algibacter sp.]|uniref:DUF4296 domain-containing protein n=1 Tax=uncultured Algibacter sp. TaxID=298659 RepID=UPI002608BFD4|nr:DUF4296 domain-containing protein [uncultured Algibacter sp.]
MILKRFIWCIFLFLMVLACNRFDGPSKPENLIPKEKMVSILIDSKLLTVGNTTTKGVMRDSNVDMTTYIYKKHKIDSLQFALSNSYYAFHVDEYEEIYTLILDSLERLEIELKDLQAQEWKEQTKREEDSLKLIAKEKDSLKLMRKLKDSLGLEVVANLDSLKMILSDIKDQKNESLITPVFDTIDQQH